MLFLINAQMHLAFAEEFWEKLVLFFLCYSTVALFYSIVSNFSVDDIVIRGSCVFFFGFIFFFEKSRGKI